MRPRYELRRWKVAQSRDGNWIVKDAGIVVAVFGSWRDAFGFAASKATA